VIAAIAASETGTSQPATLHNQRLRPLGGDHAGGRPGGAPRQSPWEQQWLNPVPGADLLTRIWQEYLERGYSKSVDGALLAAQISPPYELVRAVGSFTEID
jgi:hypothetical protein